MCYLSQNKINIVHLTKEKISLYIAKVVFSSLHRTSGVHRPASSPISFNSNKTEIPNSTSKASHNLKAKTLLKIILSYNIVSVIWCLRCGW